MPTLAEAVAAKQELDRRACQADPLVFLRRHVSIEEPDGTVIRLRLWDFQADAVTALHEHGAVIVLKARRLGLSWIYLAYALWLAIFHQGVRVLVLCKTERDASELLDRIRRMRDRLANDPASAHTLASLQRPAKNRDHVTALDVGASTIRAVVGTPAAARSETAGLVILDEFAFQRGAAEIWAAVLPTTEGGGRLAAVSTGNDPHDGDGSEFAQQWSRAASGESGFHHVFIPWHARPDRDDDWYGREMKKMGDERRFRREYPTEPADAFTNPHAEYVYDREGIDAAERLGRHMDELLAVNQIPPPEGYELHLGIDWGLGTTAALIVWPLAGGGVYIPPVEVIAHRGEPVALTHRMLDVARRLPWPLGTARYDSAGGQQQQTFAEIAPDVPSYPVAFNKRKKRTVGFLRELFQRTAHGETHRVIAISPTNTVLLEQLRALKQNDKGEVVKENDHAPDALIAGVSPIAQQFPDPDAAIDHPVEA